MSYRPTIRRAAGAAALALVAGAAGCNNFLTCDECANDPNRPLEATPSQLFVGIQSNIWAQLGSDPARITGLWVQHFRGGLQQYVQIYNYGVTEQTTNGFHTSLYTGGGLVDIRRLQEAATAVNDRLMLGIAQVQEALLMGVGADLFGDLVYSEALQPDNLKPAMDQQLAIYDALQDVLDEAIANLASTGATNVGPAAADLVYGGDAEQWTRLAHTLKARLFLHTAEVRRAAYQSAYDEAKLGIVDPADDFAAPFSGAANEQNFWYQFAVVQRQGYLVPNTFFVNLLQSRNDPRLTDYFSANLRNISAHRLAPDYAQPLVTANENLLIWAEAAYRTGREDEARTQLNAERALAGLGPVALTVTGRELLNEILIEKYIAMYQNVEAWNDYKRTCTPNLAPADPNRKIPARLYYDSAQRQTNPDNIPIPSQQPTRNQNDPRNEVSDGTGDPCLGQ